jgi:hypothetical protein
MSWLNAYRALLNWGLAPGEAEARLSEARELGYSSRPDSLVVHQRLGGTFRLVLR